MSAPVRPRVVGHVVLSLQVGGLERVVSTLALAQNRAGRRVVVYCLDAVGALADPLLAAGMTVRRVGRGARGFDPGTVARLARMLRTDGVGVVHCHNYGGLVYGSLAARVAGCHGVVYTVHGARTAALRATRLFQRARLVGDVVFVSEDARRVAVQASAVDARRARTIANGVDVDAFARSREAGAAVRREFGIDAGARVVGIVARLARAKDHATLFDAVARLRARRPALRCLVVGDGELREELHGAASELGLDGVVVFAGARSDVRAVLSAMDVFVLSSRTEGLAVTLLEAMAAGLPVVATRVGGNPEVVDDETGRLVPAGDAGALADALAPLVDEPARAEALGRAGLVRVRARFSLEAMLRSYDDVYRHASRRGRDRD